jgi:hypothetical protein
VVVLSGGNPKPFLPCFAFQLNVPYLTCVCAVFDQLQDARRHRVYFDRGYGGESLATGLAEAYGCEFVMKCAVNRPQFLFKSCLVPFASASGSLQLASAYTVVHGRPINAISNEHHHGKLHWVENFITNCWDASLTTPTSGRLRVGADYSRHFWYIDRFNQTITANAYRYRHSNYKAALLDFALSVALQNAHVVYSERYGATESLKRFIELVAAELSPDTHSARHVLVSLGMSRQCAQCNHDGKNSKTTSCCAVCFSHPPLHLNCFGKYHDLLGLPH